MAGRKPRAGRKTFILHKHTIVGEQLVAEVAALARARLISLQLHEALVAFNLVEQIQMLALLSVITIERARAPSGRVLLECKPRLRSCTFRSRATSQLEGERLAWGRACQMEGARQSVAVAALTWLLLLLLQLVQLDWRVAEGLQQCLLAAQLALELPLELVAQLDEAPLLLVEETRPPASSWATVAKVERRAGQRVALEAR